VSQTFAVPILGNATDEPDRTVNLVLTPVDIPLGTPSAAVLNIGDNDAAGRAQFVAAAFSGLSSSRSILIRITRTGGTGPASVGFATRDGTAVAGSDYTATAGEVTFGPGETSKSFTVVVTSLLRPASTSP
jgi:hypothetical protein